MDAASLRIECEEDGFHLIIDGDSPDPEYTAAILDYRIQDIDLDAFYDQVKARIGSYLRERDEARWVMPAAYDVREAYDLNDPKHPDFHSVHADYYDSRDGK